MSDGCVLCGAGYWDGCPRCGVDARRDGELDGFADPHPDRTPAEHERALEAAEYVHRDLDRAA